jgi:hypothetical protein
MIEMDGFPSLGDGKIPLGKSCLLTISGIYGAMSILPKVKRSQTNWRANPPFLVIPN